MINRSVGRNFHVLSLCLHSLILCQNVDMLLLEIIDSLLPEEQCRLLLHLQEKQTNVVRKCQLMVLVLQRHPETMREHGVRPRK